MASLARIGLIIGLLVAVALQIPIVQSFGRVIRVGLTFGKNIQPLSDFPNYQCRRIHDERVQACEDMWLSESTRQVFMACSDPLIRPNWFPNEGGFKFTSRSTRDAIVVMDLETLEIQTLPMTGFTGTQGDGVINLLGFTGLDKDDGSVELFIPNFRPSIDHLTGQIVADQATVGANVTIEVLMKRPGRSDLEHFYTLVDPLINTPNRVTVVEGQGLYITNDHGQHKPGLLSKLSPFLNTGDVVFCPVSTPDSHGCAIVSQGHGYPNGLMYSLSDKHVYVPSAAHGSIKIYKPHSNGSLELRHEIAIPSAVDNLSEDRNGDIWAAVIPDAIGFFKHMGDPFHRISAASVFKISRRGSEEFDFTKVLEDRDGEVLPATTTVVHDATTGRLFLSGVLSPFITICDATK